MVSGRWYVVWLVSYLWRFYIILKIISLALLFFHSFILNLLRCEGWKKNSNPTLFLRSLHSRQFSTDSRIAVLSLYIVSFFMFTIFYLVEWFVWAREKWCLRIFITRARNHKIQWKRLFSSSTLKHRRLGKSVHGTRRMKWKKSRMKSACSRSFAQNENVHEINGVHYAM